MKTLIKIISIIGFSMAVQNASAVSGSYCLNAEFADFNLVGETLEPGGSTSALLDIRAGTVDHDYDSLGFDNSVDHITDGAVMFLFKDRTTGEKSKFGIDLGDFISDFSVNESFSLTYNSGVFIGNIILNYNALGYINLAVDLADSVQNSVVKFKGAAFAANIEPCAVPDSGSTIAFLGLAVAGVVGLRRKKSSSTL